MIKIKKNSTILFQGDSVTDCGRSRDDDSYLGTSYVKDINEALKKYNIKVINRSVGGAKVNDLLARFDKDFKECHPDYIFILIGVNDTWHDFPNQKKTSVFKEQYKELLQRIKEEINVPVIIMEPFILGYKEKYIIMRDDLHEKVIEIKNLAKKYNCDYIAFEDSFMKIITKENEEEYSNEGIHPKEKGYEFMTKVILNNIEIID